MVDPWQDNTDYSNQATSHRGEEHSGGKKPKKRHDEERHKEVELRKMKPQEKTQN